MSQPFVAEIRAFGFNFAPMGWAVCNGQILAIAQYAAVFSLLGVQYGGNGVSNFALPNLQGAMPLGAGSGPGLTPRTQGEIGETPTVAVAQSTMPAHNHGFHAGLIGRGTTATNVAAGNSVANGAQTDQIYSTTTSPLVPMAAGMVTSTGGGQPHNNLMQYLTLNFCIALQGIFPPRN